MTQYLLNIAFGLLTFVSPVRAELLKSTKPGIMCSSAEALAKLSIMHVTTIPRGGDLLPPAAQAIANAGECTGFPAGFVVTVTSKRVNTSIVRADTLSGDGVLGTEVIANIDFKQYEAPQDAFYSVIRARCPNRIEILATLGPPSYNFVQSLPPRVRSSIERAVEAMCSDKSPCIHATTPDELTKRHLETGWAEFVCAHPDDTGLGGF